MNTNGILSFQKAYKDSLPQRLDSPNLPAIPLIAPFWSDVNIITSGDIFYRMTSDSTFLQHAEELLQNLVLTPGSVFHPTIIFISTWDRVAQYVNPGVMSDEVRIVLCT